MIHKTANGWLWDAKPHIRMLDPIPVQMRLSVEDVKEFMPKAKPNKVRRIVEQNEMWVRSFGVCLLFKKDGEWLTNYRKVEG